MYFFLHAFRNCSASQCEHIWTNTLYDFSPCKLASCNKFLESTTMLRSAFKHPIFSLGNVDLNLAGRNHKLYLTTSYSWTLCVHSVVHESVRGQADHLLCSSGIFLHSPFIIIVIFMCIQISENSITYTFLPLATEKQCAADEKFLLCFFFYIFWLEAFEHWKL